MDLDAFGFPLIDVRGLLTRLAKDCGLFETWSSGTALDLLDRGLVVEAPCGSS